MSEAYLWTLGLPFIGALMIPMAGLVGKQVRWITAMIFGFATAVASVWIWTYLHQGTSLSLPWISGVLDLQLGADGLSAWMASVAGVLGVLIIGYSGRYMELEAASGLSRYYALILLFIGAMMGLVLTTNLLVLYFFWEITGLCSYALIGFHYKNPKAGSAGMKALITTRIGDIGLFAGIMILYLNSNPHSFEIPVLIQRVAEGGISSHALGFAGFAVLAGAFAKSAQIPFHVWLPDAMEAPTPISALIHAATMVNAGVYLLSRLSPVFGGVPYWNEVILWVGAMTALVGAIAALAEWDLKKMLAYSTMSQLGFMMVAVGAGSIVAAQFHLMSHAVFKALLFLSAGVIIHHVGSRDIRVMGGLLRSSKGLALAFAVGLGALSGLPLFNGFWSKDMIFFSLAESGRYVLLTLVVITAAFTVAYSLKAFFGVFMGKPAKQHHGSEQVSLGMAIPLGVLSIGVLVSWTLIGGLTALLRQAGYDLELIGISELIHETFRFSPALIGSILALGGGTLLFLCRESLLRFVHLRLTSAIRLVEADFGFNKTYYGVRDQILRTGKAIFEGYDERIADGFEYIIVSQVKRVNAIFRRGHTGDLGLDVLGIMLGVLILFSIIFWL